MVATPTFRPCGPGLPDALERRIVQESCSDAARLSNGEARLPSDGCAQHLPGAVDVFSLPERARADFDRHREQATKMQFEGSPANVEVVQGLHVGEIR